MEGLKLGPDEIIEIIATYTATSQSIPAMGETPGWFVVGAFRMRVNYAVALAAIVSVSDESLTLRARLFDMTAALPVAIHLATQSMVDEYVQSGPADLDGGHVYQMQVEVTGNSGLDYFGSAKAISLITGEMV